MISGPHGGGDEKNCVLGCAPCSLVEVQRSSTLRQNSTRLHGITSQEAVLFRHTYEQNMDRY
jgi:hypothetical protein